MSKYTPQKIADELTKTALGESYHWSSLYDAMDFPCVNDDDKRCLYRYMDGSELNTDHVKLQDIALKIQAFKG